MRQALSTIFFLAALFFLAQSVFSRAEASSGSTFTMSILPVPECSDGGDNDDDTFIDFPDDPDCTNALDETEDTQTTTGGGGGGGSPSAKSGTISLAGSSFPGSTVVVLKDGVQAGEITTDTDNHFSFLLNAVTPGTYNFSLYAIDASGNRTTPLAFVVISNSGSLTNVADIIMPPEIFLDKVAVTPSDTFVIQGLVVPDATTMLYLDGVPFATVATLPDGTFSREFAGSILSTGTHHFSAQSTLGTAKSSYSKEWTIESGTVSVYTPEFSTSIGDSNDDGKIDIIDLSVMVYWFNKEGFPAVFDIIPDGSIDILDLSVLTYHWTG